MFFHLFKKALQLCRELCEVNPNFINIVSVVLKQILSSKSVILEKKIMSCFHKSIWSFPDVWNKKKDAGTKRSAL